MVRDFTKSKASVLLDLVRAVAAILVLVEHWRNIFFIDFMQIKSHRPLFALPYLLTSAGHQAVVIFFVLSGYLISGSVFRMLKRNQWHWPTYLLHRGLRLWIVLIPGLLLCALWDGIGIHSKLAPLLYQGATGNHTLPDAIANHTATIFLGNLAFLQTVLVPTFGSDSALWSLSFEFWYYMLFPLGLFVVLPKIPVRVRILCAVLFSGIAWFVGKDILLYFPVWLSGTLLALIPAPKFRVKGRIVACLLYVPVFFLFTKLDALNGGVAAISLELRDYMLTIATFLFLWALLSAVEPSSQSKGEHLIRETSRFSYTLYVVHMPLCVLMTALILGDQRWNPDPLHIFFGLLCLAVLIAYAYGVASITEFKTDRVRRWIEGKLGLGRVRPSVEAAQVPAKLPS
jgi:peptidoglycan/LPS O-acetylase OafA/YrhL